MKPRELGRLGKPGHESLTKTKKGVIDTNSTLEKIWSSCNSSDSVSEKQELNYLEKLEEQSQGNSEISISDKNKATDLSKERELQAILDKAKPVLPDGVKEHLDVMIKYHDPKVTPQDKPSDPEYVEAFKQAFQKMSPECWQEYEARKVEIVVNRDKKPWNYAKPKYEDGEWKFYLPLKTDCPRDILLRAVDETLTLRYHDKLRNGDVFDVDTNERAKIVAKAFEINMKLGEEYGWNVTEAYPLAFRYKQDYEGGIREAFSKGVIDRDTPEEEVRKIGYEHAYERLLERNKDSGNYLNLLPGHYFREWDAFQKMNKEIQLKEPIQLKESIRLDKEGPIEIRNDNKTLFIKEPIKLGTIAYKILEKFIYARREERIEERNLLKSLNKDDDPKFGNKLEKLEKLLKEEHGLKVAIFGNGEGQVLPYYFSNGEESKHSIAAGGEPCRWAGEDFSTSESNILKGDSGHYLTYNSEPEKQKAIFQYALSVLKKYEVDTSDMTDISLMGRRHAKKQSKDEIESKPSGE